MRSYHIMLLIAGFLLVPALTQAQKYLVLEKAGTVKNFKYRINNRIIFEVGGMTVAGKITDIRDSSIVINSTAEFFIHEIDAVTRESRLLRNISNLLFIRAGAAYFLVVGINRTINHEYPVIDESTITISAAMIAAGVALKPFIRRHFELGQKWRLKILNFDVFY